MSQFSKLGLSDWSLEPLTKQQINKPTAVQEKVIPIIMEGQDVIVQAQTGTGKTLAFVLPILEKLDTNADHIQALILTPTRELAIQITAEIKKMLEGRNDIRVLSVYGGQDVNKQLNQLKRNMHIVVATPGRLLDHIRRETVDLSNISFFVLDEADQMLHIGFQREVDDIIQSTPFRRQTLLFSATMPETVTQLAKKHLNEPKIIHLEKKNKTADLVDQTAYLTTDRGKQPLLIALLEEQRPYLAVVFCRTIQRAMKLNHILKTYGFDCEELHGDMSQPKRERAMKQFREAKIQVLVATDVAARGLDVEGITHVYNYDIPEDQEGYVHRIGRTGRAGVTGTSVTFYTEEDKNRLSELEENLHVRFSRIQSPADSLLKEISLKLHAQPSVKVKRNKKQNHSPKSSGNRRR
ncbi:DEAD/DEAH box helicase [Bacillus sp. 1P06AnD]|uniref:DEAD/DEAH box helicase n=1 Tax=Bacillus sp. 1P06AnD TaxID=3132208 RepID=UPI0039A292FB